MIDNLTGWAEAIPIAKQRAVTVVPAVYSKLIARYNVPERIHFNHGVQFESALFQELCAAFGIEKSGTTPYRPQANGKCKQFNWTLITMMRRAIASRPYYWKPLILTML